MQLDGHDLRRLRRPAEPSPTFLAHSLAITDTYVQLTEAERAGTIDNLSFMTEPACWQRYRTASIGDGILRPDGLLSYSTGGRQGWWFLEVDLGTERTPALRAKADRYADALRYGLIDFPVPGVFPQVLWIVPDQERAEFVRRAVEEADAPGELWRYGLAGQPLKTLDS